MFVCLFFLAGQTAAESAKQTVALTANGGHKEPQSDTGGWEAFFFVVVASNGIQNKIITINTVATQTFKHDAT